MNRAPITDAEKAAFREWGHHVIDSLIDDEGSLPFIVISGWNLEEGGLALGSIASPSNFDSAQMQRVFEAAFKQVDAATPHVVEIKETEGKSQT